MQLPDIHFEYQELFEDFFSKMLKIRDGARESMYKPTTHYEDFLKLGNFDLYGLTAASDDAEVYGWCLELWALECHHPIPADMKVEVCPICRKSLPVNK